jgi:hypothetical protein
MSIVIDENIVGIWYAMTGDMEDFMLAISRCPDGLELVYRHRYYASKEDPWDEKDRKSWYRMVTSQPDEQKAVETARQMLIGVVMIAQKMGKVTGKPEIFELVRGDASVEKFADALRSMPWAHSQEGTVQ